MTNGMRMVINEAYLDRVVRILAIEEKCGFVNLPNGELVTVTSLQIENDDGDLEKIIDGKTTVTLLRNNNTIMISLLGTDYMITIKKSDDEEYIFTNQKLQIKRKIVNKELSKDIFKRFIVDKLGDKYFYVEYLIKDDNAEVIKYGNNENEEVIAKNSELINLSDEELVKYAQEELNGYGKELMEDFIPEDDSDDDSNDECDGNAIRLADKVTEFDISSVPKSRLPVTCDLEEDEEECDEEIDEEIDEGYEEPDFTSEEAAAVKRYIEKFEIFLDGVQLEREIKEDTLDEVDACMEEEDMMFSLMKNNIDVIYIVFDKIKSRLKTKDQDSKYDGPNFD